MLLVSDALLLSANTIVIDHKEKIEKGEDYLKDDRKRLKVIVDSFIEQLVENIAAEKPRNILHARLLVARWLADPERVPDFEQIFRQLSDLLAEYDIFEDTDYIDYEDKVTGFLKESFLDTLLVLQDLPTQVGAGGLSLLIASIRSIP